jgi:tricorn protease
MCQRLRLHLLAWVVVWSSAGLVPATAQEPIHFARTPDISHDGKLITFSYLGDIWVVDSIGGVARPVTTHEAHEMLPVFSPDGRYIAFSSNRHGGYDVFVVPVQGGKPRRLTFDAAHDYVCGWTPDGQQILFSSMRGESFPLTEYLYTVPLEGGREQRVSLADAREGVFSPDGSRLAFVRGPGVKYRKNYRGSSSTDIWTSKADGSENRQVTTFPGLDESPMWGADGQTLYYVSEQFGPANVCRLKLNGNGKPEQVTFHGSGEAVREARISANGKWLVYEAGADLWVCSTNGTPMCRKVSIEAYADDRTNPEQIATFSSNITEYAFTPNEHYVAIVVFGEVFVMPSSGGKATRVTHHPGRDHEISWAPDMKKLVFVSDRDGEDNIYVAEADDAENPDFVKARSFKVTQLTKGKVHDSEPKFAPSGKLIAFLRDGRLWTMQPDGSKPQMLVKEPHVLDYEFSPDSKWIAYSRMDGNFASEIYLIPADGGSPTNLTRYATRNFGVSWSRDGTRLAFLSQRRQNLDAFVILMHRQLPEGERPKPNQVDLEGIHRRAYRITALNSDQTQASISPDGNQVVFRSNVMNQDNLWIATVDGSSLRKVTSGESGFSQVFWAKSGNIYYLDYGGSLRMLRGGGTLTPPFVASGGRPGTSPPSPEAQGGRISFTAKMRIHRNELFSQMFEECMRKLEYRFYDAKLHGANWAEVRDKFRPLVRHVACHEDFYHLVNLLLGELNASHLGVGGRARSLEEDTAQLGILWDWSYRGPGYKIGEILAGSPADQPGVDLKQGQYLMAIDGLELTAKTNLSQVLNDKIGEAVTLTVASDPKDPKRRKVKVKTTGRGTIYSLLYRRWTAQNAKLVQELTYGKYGYIHITSMDLPSLDEFVRALYTENADKEGLIIDVRFNGGGFTHDQVLSYLGGKEHTKFVSREGAEGHVMRQNDRKWTKPLVVLMNNRSYSDAEIFSSAVRALGLGKLVGIPTGGFVIGTYNDSLMDGSFFRIPRLGVFTLSGVNMEKEGVVPDYIVDIHPEQAAKGEDPQLAKAIEVLRKDIELWKKGHKLPGPLVEGKPSPAPLTPTGKTGPTGSEMRP